MLPMSSVCRVTYLAGRTWGPGQRMDGENRPGIPGSCSPSRRTAGLWSVSPDVSGPARRRAARQRSSAAVEQLTMGRGRSAVGDRHPPVATPRPWCPSSCGTLRRPIGRHPQPMRESGSSEEGNRQLMRSSASRAPTRQPKGEWATAAAPRARPAAGDRERRGLLRRGQGRRHGGADAGRTDAQGRPADRRARGARCFGTGSCALTATTW